MGEKYFHLVLNLWLWSSLPNENKTTAKCLKTQSNISWCTILQVGLSVKKISDFKLWPTMHWTKSSTWPRDFINIGLAKSWTLSQLYYQYSACTGTHPNSCDQLRRLHVTQYHCGYCKLEYVWGYYEGTLMLLWQATAHPVAAESPHRTLNGTPTCSSHIGTALYETHVAGQEESADLKIFSFSADFSFFCCPNLRTFNYFQPNWAILPWFQAVFQLFLAFSVFWTKEHFQVWIWMCSRYLILTVPCAKQTSGDLSFAHVCSTSPLELFIHPHSPVCIHQNIQEGTEDLPFSCQLIVPRLTVAFLVLMPCVFDYSYVCSF